MARLDDTLSSVVGGKTAKALNTSFGMRTVDDLLRHYPRRYAHRKELTDLRSLRVDEHVTVMAEVRTVTSRRMRNRPGSLLEAVVTDGRGEMTLTFFNQAWRQRDLKPGRRGLFAGKVGRYRGSWQLAHPDYLLLPDPDDSSAGADAEAAAFSRELIPVYPATSAFPTWRLDQTVRLVIETLDGPEPGDDPLPPSVRDAHGLLGLREALVAIHQPQRLDDVARARQRLRYDEAFVLQVVLAQRRHDAAGEPAVARAPRPDGLLDAFDRRLPFALTTGQEEVAAAIAADLRRSHPMHRLLQGEVGSGKTVVAVRAMLTVVDSGGQAALLAPTEVLAAQHHRSIRTLLGPLAERGLLGGSDTGTRVVLLTGSLTAARRRAALLEIASGEAGIVVGTHALLQQRVQFADLGLVVVDEQHRFGVEQRAALAEKSPGGTRPHVLVMTATPIPRTVAMTVFGDLDVSTLTELPAGRAPIATHVVPALEKPGFLDRAWARIREEVEAGRQAYVVCPRIGGDAGAAEDLDPADGPADPDLAADASAAGDRRAPLAVLDVAPMLTEGPLAGVRVGVLHGRMPTEEKDDVMRRFVDGPDAPDGIDVLVATTVIEVGVDVPNATVMVVMDADRFGVSQLHQVRGRVGRGRDAGLCLLVTHAPPGTPARERLDAVAASNDGFVLSRLDLQQRREGDVLGAEQSGRRSSLRLLSVLHDEDVIVSARADAAALVAADPSLSATPALRRAVEAMVAEEQAEFLQKS